MVSYKFGRANPITYYNIENESYMEKYGVETGNEAKTAESGGRKVCPRCGQELEKVDGIYLRKCPSHGTEPFEAKP